ncbi:uncharacterized protein LOC123868048 [Maniola jurtina]|uniref:uncharacterized protein LOC123868048 n=1 Tax=Maniola jurtina TaxID=191418 RepID=UPI001E688F9F|nr:uncharacterized protein LOC123868048 [Maniola jurtina]
MADRKLDDQKEFILECIRLYKDLPTLWNVKSKVYYDRDKKDMAYKILLRKYRQWFPKATRDDLKKKLNALRTNYRKELRKYLQSVENESDPVYEPTLWYYKDMSFLHDLQKPGAETDSSMDVEQNYAVILDVDEENSTESRASTPVATEESPIREPVQYSSTVSESTRRETPITVVKKRVDKDDNVMKMSYENLSDNKDEYFHWAMACASDLRKMERTQQVFAKKAIAEIMMEGQLGLLNRYSVKVNESQGYGHSSKSVGQFSSSSSPSYIHYVADQHSQDLDKKPFVRNPLDDDA